MSDAASKLDQLREWMRSLSKVLVAYSGGVDSSLVLKVAVEELGNKAVGMLAISPSLPQSERQDAVRLAASMGAKLIERHTGEVDDARYQANAANRCYFCKTHVYAGLVALAAEIGAAVAVDGMNAEDTLDLRPGRAAARELQVRSPLHEFGFSKAEVRSAARALGLSNWDKPAAACLASRIPYGTQVTPKRLAQVEKAEELLKKMGFTEVRVRHHGDVARVEIPKEQLGSALAVHEQMALNVRSAGFAFVSLDLDGLRSGSLNEPLRERAQVDGVADS